METIALSDFILYGFLAFIGLLLVAMFVALLRQGRDIGELKGDIGELRGEIRAINSRLDDLTGRVTNLEQTVMTLGREVGEVKGLVLALHQRVDPVMRHRHEPGTGQVILTPEEVAAD